MFKPIFIFVEKYAGVRSVYIALYYFLYILNKFADRVNSCYFGT